MKSFLRSRLLWGVFIIACVAVLLYHYLYGHFIVPKKEGLDRQWHEYVDVVYYINLDERADLTPLRIESAQSNVAFSLKNPPIMGGLNEKRCKTAFLEEMRKMGVPSEKIVRIPGVRKPGKEDWGRSLSHMIAMEYFLDTSHNNCIVFEDDFVFTQDLQTVNGMFADVFQNSRNFDIIMLSADESDLRPTQHKHLQKVFAAEGASGYMVNSYYAQPLMQNLQDGAKTIEKSYEAGKSEELQGPFRVDKYWKRLQPQSNWFVFSPKLGGSSTSM